MERTNCEVLRDTAELVFHDEDRVPYGWVHIYVRGKFVAQVRCDDLFDQDGNRFDWEG